MLVLKHQSLYGGVLDEDVVLQSIKIYAPNEDDKVINVISNAYVEDEVKHIITMQILFHRLVISLIYYMVLVIRMILTI